MEKLDQAKKVNIQIEELESFLPIAEEGGKYSTKYKQSNTFTRLELTARIWTGTDNPRYQKMIENPEIIKELMDMCLPLIKAKIALKKAELESLFK